MKDTFIRWGVQRIDDGEFTALESTRQMARRHITGPAKRVVKLECRIVQPQRKPKLDAKATAAAFKLWKGGAR
jgi:hypothetical protein